MINIFSLSRFTQENSMCRHSERERDKTIGVIFIDDDDEIREEKHISI
jgi:hypothetical protein